MALEIQSDGAETMGNSVALRGGPVGQRYEFDANQKPDWRIHRASWSLASSELYPFDPAVIAAIRTIRPWHVPVVRNLVCVATTGEVARFTHHGLAYVTLTPKLYNHDLRFIRCVDKTDVNGRIDATDAEIIVERVLEGPQHEAQLPGEFRPIGWGIYYLFLQDDYEQKRRMAAEREEAKRLVTEAEREAYTEDVARREISERMDHYAPDLMTDLGVRASVSVS